MLNKIKTWLRENRVDVLVMVGLFIIAAVPRMADLGTFLTADEKNWMGRSYEFIRAVKDWRFNDTLQTTHPGVTTLWISGAAITGYMFLTHTLFSYGNLAHFAAAAQFPVALATSLAVPVMYLFLRRLFDNRFVPILGSLFIALDSFLIGYSRVVHVDALLTSLMLMAALAAMIYAQSGYKRNWLIASAVLSGLAILTKFPALFLVPFWWLAVLFKPAPTPGEESSSTPGEVARSHLRDFTLWLIVIALMFVIIWPAMLYVPDPKGNALIIKRDLVIAAETPHNMTEEYTVNSAHYPLTLLTRTNPVTLIFASVALLWMLLSQFSIFSSQFSKNFQFFNDRRRVLVLLVAYIFFFVLMMTLVAKKGDRYILPVFLALDVLAAFGIWIMGRRLRWIAGAAAVVYLAMTVWNYHPYAIAYSNPLFPDNLSQELGWGEGLEQVAAWLNENDPKAVVASWYPEELGAYTSARVAHINAHEQSKVKYVVLYRNMFGRAPVHYANNFIDEYYKKRDPVFIAHVAGKEFAWVYEKWVFDRIIGELVPDKQVRQEVAVAHDNLAGLDVLIATYSGRAKLGNLVITVPDIYSWKIPVSEIADDRWLTLRLPKPLNLQGQKITVEISAEGTSAGNAPTVRSNQDRLAVRLRYGLGNGQEATEEDTRLLQIIQAK